MKINFTQQDILRAILKYHNLSIDHDTITFDITYGTSLAGDCVLKTREFQLHGRDWIHYDSNRSNQ